MVSSGTSAAVRLAARCSATGDDVRLRDRRTDLLIVYFAAQPDPTLKWMYWFGPFITAADVLIALALTSSGAKSMGKKDSE